MAEEAALLRNIGGNPVCLKDRRHFRAHIACLSAQNHNITVFQRSLRFTFFIIHRKAVFHERLDPVGNHFRLFFNSSLTKQHFTGKIPREAVIVGRPVVELLFLSVSGTAGTHIHNLFKNLIDRSQNFFAASEIRRQLYKTVLVRSLRLRRNKPLLLVCEQLRTGIPKAVYALLYIAYHKHVVFPCKGMDDRLLKHIGILILVQIDFQKLFSVGPGNFRDT